MKKFLALLIVPSLSFGTMTRVRCTHVYPNTPTSIGTNVAGNLLVIGATNDTSTAFAVSDTAGGGNTYSSLPFSTFAGGGSRAQIFYTLSCKGGANTVTVTPTGGSDPGYNVCEISASGGATWSVDSSMTNGSFKSGSSGLATTAARTDAWSTSGSDDYIFMLYGDESNTQASHTPTTNFAEVNWDNGHVDAIADWLDAPAQGSTTSGWDIATSCTSWGLYAAAFSATTSVAAPVVGRLSVGGFGVGSLSIGGAGSGGLSIH